ncbi:hypothetical protein D8X92_13710 [Listeria ivanovii]|uniref:Uncharacterized protein n=1 Tax=Listeria ivanovii subsp. londoniensis TaxID=202752 RepID=A0ABS1G7T6_LISIV|nr:MULTISPECIES: hypothetical protein [Listeria]MBK1962944.1 hypothetical protein [Listeria ivanovii subsp. londoniensis]MBM5721746.1 hypothetical protein [Listeria ivanovii]
MDPLKKITIRVNETTFQRLKASRLSDGDEIERIFRQHDQQAQKLKELSEQLTALQKEKQLLFELSNKLNMTIDVLNTIIASMDITEFIAHDVDPTEVMQAAKYKQEGRIKTMRNY